MGVTLGKIAFGRDKWWSYSTEKEGEESFTEIFDLFHGFCLPFFNSTQSAKDIISAYESNIWRASKIGSKILWGTSGWENYDFGHVYLMAGNRKESLKQFDKSLEVFDGDEREWAKIAFESVINIKKIVMADQATIDRYLTETIEESKQKLKLTGWE